MAIVTSEIVEDKVLSNPSRRSIVEKTCGSFGVGYSYRYKLSIGADETINLAAHAVDAWDGRVLKEKNQYLVNAREGISPEVPLTPDYATIPALKKYLIRQGFILAGQQSAIAIIPLIDSLSDANIRATVDITQARVDQIRARVVNLKPIDTAIEDDKGDIIAEEEDI